jgi:signal transduction histidine kinase
VLRTLTHELRTPAASLRVDVEPLRAAYDELPVSCQEPVLRVSDSVERLLRVLHRSARYLALFETEGSARLVHAREVASTREMFAGFSEEWPEGASLEAASEDGPVVTDEEWLGVAVRNLVENAARHGAPPVRVRWSLEGPWLLVAVSDGGSSESLVLSRAALPWDRSPESSGLGLGLAIVLRVAQLLGGRLSHRPAPTVFELRIPARAGTT